MLYTEIVAYALCVFESICGDVGTLLAVKWQKTESNIQDVART